MNDNNKKLQAEDPQEDELLEEEEKFSDDEEEEEEVSILFDYLDDSRAQYRRGFWHYAYGWDGLYDPEDEPSTNKLKRYF